MPIKYNRDLLPNARKLRRDMTPQERKLWYLCLKDHSIKVYRQRIVRSYIVDFYCAAAKLVIELDGSQHYDRQGLTCDANRDEELKQEGLEIIRLSNRDIDERFADVCAYIDHVIHKRTLRDEK